MGYKLKIDNKHDWVELYWTLWKAGLLRDIPLKDINLSNDAFPVEIPIEITNLTELLTKPAARIYRSKIDTALHESLAKVIG